MGRVKQPSRSTANETPREEGRVVIRGSVALDSLVLTGVIVASVFLRTLCPLA
eukprot:COSAG01_NODE_30923_length_607_cov_0.486220_2_plen_52_part_01